MARIVIVGAGLGGVPMAYEMKALARDGDTVTLVHDRDYFHFVPSNPWVAVNWREAEAIKIPLEKPMAEAGIEFIPVAVNRVDPDNNALTLADGRTLDYDHLVLCTGAKLAFDEIPGLGRQENYTQSICHVDHTAAARTAWDDFVRDPGPIVVGAVQGASCFGPAYEFAFIMDADLRRRRIRDQVPMTFVTSEPYIGHLGLGGVGDSKTMLESELRQRHIGWITNAKIDRVEPETMHVTEMAEDGTEKTRHDLPFSYGMMIPAFTGIDAIQGLEGLVNPRGFVLIDKKQRNPQYGNVWAVGVAVAIPPVGETPVPVGVPKTGFMIESMVTAAANNIRAVLDGGLPTTEATWNAVCLADMGDTGLAFVASPQIPPRNVNWMKKGKWVHYAKILFEKYYLRKVRRGVSEPFYEKYALQALGLRKLKDRPPQ